MMNLNFRAGKAFEFRVFFQLKDKLAARIWSRRWILDVFIKCYFVYLSACMNPKALYWLKKFGVAGFLFFLIKGLVWLAIFYYIGARATE